MFTSKYLYIPYGEPIMKKSIIESLTNLSIRKKIVLLLILAIVLNGAALLLGTFRIKSIYSDKLYQTLTDQLSTSGQELSEKLQTIQDLSLLLMSNETLQEDLICLKDTDISPEKSKINKELRSILHDYSDSFSTSYINYITLYCDAFSSSSDSFASRTTTEKFQKQIRCHAEKADGRPIWTNNPGNNSNLFLGREIRSTKNMSLTPLGEIIISVDIDRMMADSSSSSNKYDSSASLLFDDSELLYHSDSFTDTESDLLYKLIQDGYEDFYLNGHHYMAVRSTIPGFRWNYICLVMYDSLFLDLQKSNTLLIYTLLISAGLLTLFGLSMFNSFGRHILLLKDKMLLASTDLGSVPSNQEFNNRSDEIGIVHQQFDQMVQQLNDLIQENYVNELQIKEAQLQALQSQINPHFLYNTLESINWRAKMAGSEDISEMVQALAGLLRVTLKKENHSLTVKQEIDLVENYLRIQQYRFEDRLVCSIAIPEEIWNVKIPCLCLQPLTENAIRYGIEENIDPCEIRIEGFEKDGYIHMLVKNNGSEFEEDILEKLREEKLKPRGHGVGLINIDERLRLTFGDAARLLLYNEDGWAISEIIIPDTNLERIP